MKCFINTAFAAAGMLASTLSYGATVSIDFGLLTAGNVNSTTPVELNSFTALSTDGTLFINPPMFGGSGLVIQGLNTGNAIFSFDTSAVSVTSITLSGASNNVPVTITTFNLAGIEQDSFKTDNSWSSPTTLSNMSPISSFEVLMLESEVSGISITYDAVSAVPVPAAVWLFASGLFGIAGVARHKRA